MEDDRIKEKLEVVARYLTEGLGMRDSAVRLDPDSWDYEFRVDDDRGYPRCWFRISRTTLDDHAVAEIRPLLERQGIIERFQDKQRVRAIHPDLGE